MVKAKLKTRKQVTFAGKDLEIIIKILGEMRPSISDALLMSEAQQRRAYDIYAKIMEAPDA